MDKILAQRDEKLRQTATVIENTLLPVEETQKQLLQQLTQLKSNFEASKAAKVGEVSRMQHALQQHIRNEQRLREELRQERMKAKRSSDTISNADNTAVCCLILAVRSELICLPFRMLLRLFLPMKMVCSTKNIVVRSNNSRDFRVIVLKFYNDNNY